MGFNERDITARLVGKDDMSPVFNKAGDSSTRMGDKIKKAAKVGAVALAAVGVAAIKLGADSVKAAAEAEASQVKLEDAFKRFPKLSNINIEALRKYNEKLMEKTRFDDDAFASGQAVLAGFGLTGKQLKETTPLLADYAAKTGKTLPDAAKLLGKAMNGNTRALKDVGIEVELTGNKAEDYRIIQEALNDKVGGFATKDGKTAAGMAERLRNQFGELQEKVGNKLLPVLLKMGDWILKKGIPALKRFGAWIGPKLKAVVDFVREAIGNLTAKLKGNGETAERVRGIVAKLKSIWEKIAPFLQWLAETALANLRESLKKVGWVIENVVLPVVDFFLDKINAMIDAVQFLIDKWKDFKDGFSGGQTPQEWMGNGGANPGAGGAFSAPSYRAPSVTVPSGSSLRGGNSGGGGKVTLEIGGSNRQAAALVRELLRSADINFVRT